MAAGGAGAAVVQPHEGFEDLLPLAFRHAGAVVLDVDAAALVADLVVQLHPRFSVTHGVAHQVLQGAVQVTRLRLDPGAIATDVQAQASLDAHAGAQGREFRDHLTEQRIQVHPLEMQGWRTLLQARVGQHLVHQLVQFLDVAVHAVHVLAPGGLVLRVGDHLQAEAQPRHRRAQLVGHRADQLTLQGQQPLQLLGHAVEGSGQAPDRVGALGRHPRIQLALGDIGSGAFQPHQAMLQLAHQEVDGQADQGQTEEADQHQHLRRIRVHLVQRAHLQHPGRVHHAGEYTDGIAILAERHHRIALVHPAALVGVEVGLPQGDQPQVEAELLVLLDRGKTLRLDVDREAHQLIHQQVDGGPRQLLADLLHLTREHQPLANADQAEDPRRVGAGFFHQHLATGQAAARTAVQPRAFHGHQFEGDAQQPFPEHHRAAALHFIHGLQVVRHQAEGAAGQALAILVGAHLVDLVDGEYAKQRHQHQGHQHAAIDTQEDRVHRSATKKKLFRPVPRRPRVQTDNPCCAPS
ncbi:hypothetical protein D3C85_819470 [compost metagenome]